MQSRLIRLRDAPTYLGMDKNRFNYEVRPLLTEIPIGNHGVAFDRLDLDAWVEQYKARNGRPAVRRKLWDVNEHQASTNVTASGTSTKSSVEQEYAKVVKQAISRKRKDT